MHPSAHAVATPAKPAIIMASTGETFDYATLEALSNQSAHALRSLGLERGDVVATLFDNGPEVFIFGLATQRAGLFLTSISNKLSAADACHIMQDSGARVLVASESTLSLARQAMPAGAGAALFTWSSGAAEIPSWQALTQQQSRAPIQDQSPGHDMLYSSGTTGRPKGVKFPLPEGSIDEQTKLMSMGMGLYGMGPDTIYLSTSPLYHAAPQRWAMTIHRLGGTVVIMDRFDAERTLEFIQTYRITHATFVPTHFVRRLKLPCEARTAYDLSSLKAVVHAAAPCPVPVKQAMLEWWGPIIHEYYSGTEACGITALSPQEWLQKPGSVGRAVLGTLKITDDDGNELPAGQEGNICFADGPAFQYHNDPAKTAKAYDRNGWATLADIGRVDEEGYLFLTDRKSFMVISGGVNIYPLLAARDNLVQNQGDALRAAVASFRGLGGGWSG